MPGEHVSLTKSSLAYAKLAATPTDTSWSQAYNAGNLFACLSLTLAEPSEDRTVLQNLGKELFSNLEAEFFTLEEKTLETISEAIQKSTKHIPETITINFCLAFFKDNILYLFLLGSGRVIIKRENKLGILLEKQETDSATLQTASGYLQNGDTIILETSKFAQNISDHHVSEALQLSLPSDIAESLSIHMHEKADGDQAAIIIVYHGIAHHFPEPQKQTIEEVVEEENEELQQPYIREHKETSPEPPLFSRFSELVKRIRLPFFSHNRRIVMGGLTHKNKLFLSIACIILILLVISIFFTKQKQEAAKVAQLFQATYTPAAKLYDEGKALASLNPDVSRQDFQKAETLLKDGQSKFPKESPEAKQVTDLLTKIQSELGASTGVENATPVKEATVGDSDLLALEKANSEGIGFSQNDTSVFYVTPKAAIGITKSDGKKKTLVTNDSNWQQAVAIVPYQTNFYILDQKDGIGKYVPAGNSYNKTTYFKSSAPDLSKAVSMAIDSSIWVLSSDGTISKYTRGAADSFTIKGVNNPLNNPTKIYTNPDINNIYVLDNGNSRIVKLSNDGTFQKEYAAGIIKNAKDFEVDESDKKILILSGDKIWEMEM